MLITRYRSTTGHIALGLVEDGQLVGSFPAPETTMQDILHLHVDNLRQLIDAARKKGNTAILREMLKPIDGSTEVWAAGLTYTDSEKTRRQESNNPDIYTNIIKARRPELFFKATAYRVAGPDRSIALRSDSSWDVAEPELALALNMHGEIIGYTIANDVSSRSIERENPLYMPQAKVYSGNCALGPGITPVWEVPDPYNLTIEMQIERDGQICWEGHKKTAELQRSLDELVSYLFKEDEYPHGAILCTGTGLVPDYPFTLQEGDVVEIRIDQLGTLRNPVVRGNKALREAKLKQRIKGAGPR